MHVNYAYLLLTRYVGKPRDKIRPRKDRNHPRTCSARLLRHGFSENNTFPILKFRNPLTSLFLLPFPKTYCKETAFISRSAKSHGVEETLFINSNYILWGKFWFSKYFDKLSKSFTSIAVITPTEYPIIYPANDWQNAHLLA